VVNPEHPFVEKHSTPLDRAMQAAQSGDNCASITSCSQPDQGHWQTEKGIILSFLLPFSSTPFLLLSSPLRSITPEIQGVWQNAVIISYTQ